MPLNMTLLDGGVAPKTDREGHNIAAPPQPPLEQQTKPGQVPERTRSPVNWVRDRFIRTVSNESALPQIDIEPPVCIIIILDG